jgi:hypothetical protein
MQCGYAVRPLSPTRPGVAFPLSPSEMEKGGFQMFGNQCLPPLYSAGLGADRIKAEIEIHDGRGRFPNLPRAGQTNQRFAPAPTKKINETLNISATCQPVNP